MSVQSLNITDKAAPLSKPVLIHITNFINPHLFWFKCAHTMQFGHRALDALETEIGLHVKENSSRLGEYTPQLHETVALKHVTWNKWIRASVDLIRSSYRGTNTTFLLWAIDHGIPIETTSRHIQPLSKELASRSVQSAFRGGLSNVMPLQSFYNCSKAACDRRPAQAWPEGVVKRMEELCNDAVEIAFRMQMILEDSDPNNDHRFGHIEVLTHVGTRIDVGAALSAGASDLAEWLDDHTFADVILTAGTRTVNRWCERNRVLRNEMVFRSGSMAVSAASVVSGTIGGGGSEVDWMSQDGIVVNPVQKKIDDWMEGIPQKTAQTKVAGMDIDGVDDDDGESLMKKAGLIVRNRPVAEELATSSVNKKPPTALTSALQKDLERMHIDAQQKVLGTTSVAGSSCAGVQQQCLDPSPTVSSTLDANNPLIMRMKMRNNILREKKQQLNAIAEAGKANAEAEKAAAAKVEAEMKRVEANKKRIAYDKQWQEEMLNAIPESQQQQQQPAREAIKYVPAGFALNELHKFNKPLEDLMVRPPKVQKPKRIAAQFSDQCIRNSLHLHRVLVHGVHRPQPLESIEQASFTDTVHTAIRQSRYTELYRTQAYTWPHLLRGNSVMLINGPGTGKTVAYLPAICSRVQEMLTEGRVPARTVGPVAVVLCVSGRVVGRVARLARHFMGIATVDASITGDWSVVEAFGRHDTKRVKAELMSGCALLVTTPSCWRRLLEKSAQPMMDASRLKVLAVDDVDLIVERFREDFVVTYKVMALQRRSGVAAVNGDTAARMASIQVVFTARRWHNELASFFNSTRNLVLVIGAYAEASAYAGSSVQLQRLSATGKPAALIAALRQRDYRRQPTVVVCNDSTEAIAVVDALRHELIQFVLYHEEHLGDSELTLAKNWNATAAALNDISTAPGAPSCAVLICTDRTIADLRLNAVRNIVHYAIPATWTAFAYRCSASFDYIEDRVRLRACNLASIRAPPHTLILLDEHNNAHLPRLIEFLQSHGVTIDESIQQTVAQMRQMVELERSSGGDSASVIRPFCSVALLVGECLVAECPRRHVLTAADASAAELPRSGFVRLVVQQVCSPTLFNVRLLATRPPTAIGGDWQRYGGSNVAISLMAMANFYTNAAHRRTAGATVRLGELCVIEEEDAFQRCKVMSIKKSRHSATVEVLLIDIGQTLSACHPSELYHLDEQFRSIPAQSVAVRIADCVPCDGDSEWDASATQAVQQMLIDSGVGNADNIFLEARIEHTVLDTLWVDSLRVVERLPTLNTFVHLLSVRNELVKQQYGQLDDRASVVLRKMAADAGVEMGGGSYGQDVDTEDQTIELDEEIPDAEVDGKPDGGVERSDTIAEVEVQANDGENTELATNSEEHGSPNLDEENWDDCNFPSYVPPVVATSTMPVETNDDDDESEKEFDVQFSSDEIFALLNLPPTTKLLPTNADQSAYDSQQKPQANEIAVRNGTTNNSAAPPAESSDLDSDSSSTRSSERSACAAIPMPMLCPSFPFKQPLVRWHQNNSMIYLSIEAPDIVDYRLHISARVLRFHARLRCADKDSYCLLHLFGPLAIEYLSHEVRGLWLRVRLMKLLRGPAFTWPRLTRQSARLPWLQYNLDTIGAMDMETMEQRSEQKKPNSTPYRAYSESSSDDADDAVGDDVKVRDDLDEFDEAFLEPNRVQSI